jgi:hypothetical protein
VNWAFLCWVLNWDILFWVLLGSCVLGWFDFGWNVPGLGCSVW